ncbi:MAG: NnrS family protein [Thiolinea sp.]
MLNIEPEFTGRYALLHTGFRPFFLLAMASAVLLGALWAGMYSFGWSGVRADYPLLAWHAHEMLFGYALAVVSGFLLTAVRNWTGIQTVEGTSLLLLAAIWLFGRILPFVPGLPFWYLGLHEVLYLLLLLYLVVRPIVIRRQWKQLAILGKLAVLIIASVCFHLGLAGVWQAGIAFGLYLALYVLIGLILTMGRRVIPSFIENTVRNGFHALNDVWLDRLSLGLFLLFTVAELGRSRSAVGWAWRWEPCWH